MAAVSIKSNAEFEKMRTIGSIVAPTLRVMAQNLRPGMTTGELNEIGARVLNENGARSAPPLVYGYPTDVCIGVNDEAMHGIPELPLAGQKVQVRSVACVMQANGCAEMHALYSGLNRWNMIGDERRLCHSR